MVDDPVTSPKIDAEAVRRFWERAGSASGAEAASYMAHELELPSDCVRHRLHAERAYLRDHWPRSRVGESREVPSSGEGVVLDLGCGAGEWTAHFARTARRVIGVEQSRSMCDAAIARTRGIANVEILHGRATSYAVEEPVQLAFVGGCLMYMDSVEVVALLRRLAGDLGEDGVVIARESCLERGAVPARADYPVIYRTIEAYRRLGNEAGLELLSADENAGYRHMEIVVQLTEALLDVPAVARRATPAGLTAILWSALKASGRMGMDDLPRLSRRTPWPFPRLSNHFFIFRRARPRGSSASPAARLRGGGPGLGR